MTIIENPTADQLEAGGKITGTTSGGLFTFTDQPISSDRDGNLYIGSEPHIYYIRWGRDRLPVDSVTFTAYEPPEPKPWWETCPDDAWIEYTVGDDRRICTAHAFRTYVYPPYRVEGNPRRVHVSDYATVVVPRDAVADLSGEFRRLNNIQRSGALSHGGSIAHQAIRNFLAAVDEAGE